MSKEKPDKELGPRPSKAPNLGISDLLKQQEPALDLDKHVSDLIASRSGQGDLNGDGSEAEALSDNKNPYQSLADDKEWQKLSDFCESNFSSSESGDYEARLWWVHAQLRMNAVPESILAAPIESATERIIENKESVVSEIGEEKYQELAKLAIAVLKKASLRLVKKGENLLAVGFLKRVVAVDVSVVPKLLECVEIALKELEAVPEYKHNESTKDIIVGLKELQKEHRQKPETEDSLAVPDDKDYGPVMEAKPKGKSRAGRLRICLFVVLLALIASAGWYLSSFESEEIKSAHEQVVLSPNDKALSMPDTKRLIGVGHLDTLLYDIDKPQEEKTVSDTEPVKAKPQVKAKVKVNTETPVEPEEVRRIMHNVEAEKSAYQVIDENFVKSFPGRSETVKAYPVKRFSPPKVYKVLSNTKVMSRPSYKAANVADLKAGDKVEVEEDLTIWLKLRSRKGKAGYIFAQDAVPVEK